jgi:DNA-directed RNA polymerase sigma subunit (sigma70/sigma32)
MNEFRSYLKAIAEFPDFRDGDICVSALVERMRSGDKEVEKDAELALIESTLRYIAELTTGHCHKFGLWENYLELLQEANLEVMRMIAHFDPAKGPLEKFVGFRADAAFKNFWHKTGTVHLTHHGRKILNSVRREQTGMIAELGREPTLGELSKRLGRREAAVYELLQRPGVRIVDVDEQRDDEDGARVFKLDSYVSAEFNPLRLPDALELREILIDCLGEDGADLLLAYSEAKTDGFRQVYFEIHHAEISAAAARKAKQRLWQKLKNCPQAKEALFDRGQDHES